MENIMKKELFGKNKEGKNVTIYTLENKNGMKARVMDYGANLVGLEVPDKGGKLRDVVLGYDSVEEYFDNGGFFGCTVGPNGNRIKDGKFTIDGVDYQLDKNDNGHNLHSHRELGFHKKMWVVTEGENSLTFSLTAVDGEIGFPGNRKVSVTYTLTEDNELKLHYEGNSDKKTIFNMTNHTYFNLAGHSEGNVEQHLLKVNASHYTPVDGGLIPIGEIAQVAGTPFDFTMEKMVGRDIRTEDEQLKLAGGYDHNFVTDDYSGKLRKIAELKETESGIRMETFTDLPGVQIYSGNFVTRHNGKGGAVYDFRSGICFETQCFPDSVNQKNFPDVIYGPDRSYKTDTVYKFGVL